MEAGSLKQAIKPPCVKTRSPLLAIDLRRFKVRYAIDGFTR